MNAERKPSPVRKAERTSSPARKAEQLGLQSDKTNLPFVVWLLRARPSLINLSVHVTRTTAYEQPTLYELQPWYHRVSGPYRWLEMAALNAFARDNMALIEQFWTGDPTETQQAENRRIAATIKPVPDEILWWYLDMAARIEPGSTRTDKGPD
jgi:hypothetical protein